MDDLSIEVCVALGIYTITQAHINELEKWDDDDKRRVIIHAKQDGNFELGVDSPADPEYIIHPFNDLYEYAHHLICEGAYGEISYEIKDYIDYAAIVRDLKKNFDEITLGGLNFVYEAA